LIQSDQTIPTHSKLTHVHLAQAMPLGIACARICSLSVEEY